jgi:ketosteroid isomerase-like protein
MLTRSSRHLARALIGATLLLAFTAQAASDVTTKDYADSVGAAWAKAAKAGDLDAIVGLYADDAVAWFPDETEHRGAAAIRASYKTMFDTYDVVDAVLSDSHHVGDARHRTNWGYFTLSLKQKADGKIVTLKGRYTDYQEKRNGRWVYLNDHASLEPAPPAAGK